MENTHGKEISLQYVTVKVPGQKPRGSRTVPSNNNDPTGSAMAPSQSTSQIRGGVEKKGEKVLLTSYEMIREPPISDDSEHAPALAAQNEKAEAKKRHRRIKSNGMKANQEGDGN
jgi:Arf-GAP/GTPase/ANK repeat/PH domain-containing protein 1/3